MSKHTIPSKGVVTVTNWTRMPDGETYLYLYSDHWTILADEAIGEDWMLAAWRGEEIVALVPGKRVQAMVACEAPTAIAVFDLT